MRRSWWALAALTVLAGCQFKFDRTLNKGEIRGHIVFVNDQNQTVPAANATVAIESSRLSIKADSNGQFSFRGMSPGTYSFLISADFNGDGKVDAGLRLANETLDVSGQNDADGLDLGKIVIGGIGSLTGSVTNNGAPVAGATVAIQGYAQTNTDANGQFTFSDLLPGDYLLGVLNVSGATTQVIQGPDVKGRVMPAQKTLLDPFKLENAEVNTQGAVVGVAKEVGATSNENIQVVLTRGGDNPLNPVQTDTGGNYSDGSLVPGVYSVTIGDPQNVGALSITLSNIIVGGITAVQLPTVYLPGADAKCGLGTDAVVPDTDGDGIGDYCDNCPTVPNADQHDSLKNGVGDVCRPPSAGPVCAQGDAKCGSWQVSGDRPTLRAGMGFVFDSKRSRLLVFGGHKTPDPTPVAEPLVWTTPWPIPASSTPVWTRYTATGTAPALSSAYEAVYDATGDRVLAYDGTSLYALTFAATDGSPAAWQTVAVGGTPPDPRTGAAVALDTTGNRLFVFGGQQPGTTDTGPTALNDLYYVNLTGSPTWNGVTLGDFTPPSGRTNAALIYDSNKDRLLLFGGGVPSQGETMPLGDLWAFSLATLTRGAWEQVASSSMMSPPPEMDPVFVYNSDAKTLVLLDSMGALWTLGTDLSGNEVWQGATVDGNSVQIGGRQAAGSFFIPGSMTSSGTTVIFGGQDQFGFASYNDLWTLTSSSATFSWSQLQDSEDSIVGSSSFYDPTRQKLFVIDGEGGSSTNAMSQYLLFDPTAPNAPTPIGYTEGDVTPLSRSFAVSAYDSKQSRFILFGGSYGEQDMWTLAVAPLSDKPLWTALDSANGSPNAPALIHPTGVYDEANEQFVVFAGTQRPPPTGPTTAPVNDVWVRPLPIAGAGVWQKLSISDAAPTGRTQAAGVYDRVGQRLIVFGGLDANGTALNDLWTLSLPKMEQGQVWQPKWTQVTTAKGVSPKALAGATMIYDQPNWRVLMFGGLTTSGMASSASSDIYSLELDTDPPTWHKLCPAGLAQPAARSLPTVVPTPNGLVFFGGLLDAGSTSTGTDNAFYSITYAIPECPAN